MKPRTNPCKMNVKLIGLSFLFLVALCSTQAQSKKECKENKALIKEYLGAISGKEKTAAIMDQYIAEADSSLKQHIIGTESIFPKYELIPEDMIAEGNKVVVRARFRGTQEGPMGDVPATHKTVELPVALIYRVDNGKIVEHWIIYDQLSVLQQLGVM